MSLSDFKNSETPTPEGWVKINGTWSCPECGATNDQCLYNPEDGVVGKICDEHPDADIYIGRGLA